ncbi:unnamed protein product [Moneuplotes crassus]|uniref:Uncharacterized protein n=1 Tax=Euplotes crassus TaxID=5936 RepID=A0AAD1XCJ3_EUPCR|nr:unnamed protein product [Moneuplotes crassus]
MKLITSLPIALILLACAAATDTTNLITGSGADAGMSIDLLVTENSNDNMTIKLQFGFPASMMTAYKYHNLQCVDVGVSTFSLTTDATDLPVFATVLRCGSGCANPTQMSYFKYYTYLATYTSSTGVFSTSSASEGNPISGTAPDDTDSSVASDLKSIYNIATEVNGDTLASTYKLPNSATTAYLKCFSKLDYTGVFRDSANIASDLDEYPKDVTLVMPGTISTPTPTPSSSSSSDSNPDTSTSSAKKLLILPILALGLLTQMT